MRSLPWQGPLDVPPGSGPLPARIASALIRAIARAAPAPGDRLPATRELARDLGVSRSAVVAAYDELIAAGYAVPRTGSGTYVAPGATEAASAAGPQLPPSPSESPPQSQTRAAKAPTPPEAPTSSANGGHLDLRPGHPDPALISTREWRAAWRQAATRSVSGATLSGQRHPELEQALSSYLRRMRGVIAAPEEVIVAPGASACFSILAQAAHLNGVTVAIEDPGYRRARSALARAGARLRHVPVDEDGLAVSQLRFGDAAAYLTPAHQYPLGARMPVTRRIAALEWAAQHHRLLIEDDYDGEFRYGVSPMPALRSLEGARESVAYVGTASKILTPDLGLAWMVPPAHLVSAARQAQDDLTLGASPVAARALAHLMRTGALTRHLARAARLYRARRDALVAAIDQLLPTVEVMGVEAGLHLVLLLPADSNDTTVTATLREGGITVEPLSGFYARGGSPGLVIGYARMPETQATRVAGAIRDATARSI